MKLAETIRALSMPVIRVYRGDHRAAAHRRYRHRARHERNGVRHQLAPPAGHAAAAKAILAGMPLAGGNIVSSRFRLIRELGRGGMGSVWLAHHMALDVPCAIKFLAEPA